MRFEYNTDWKYYIVQTSLHSFLQLIIAIGMNHIGNINTPVGLFDISIWYYVLKQKKTAPEHRMLPFVNRSLVYYNNPPF